MHSKAFSRLVKAEPRLLFYRGQFLLDAMRHERVTEGEVLSGIRAQGIASLEDVEAVVLETSGELTAMGKPRTSPSAPADVRGMH